MDKVEGQECKMQTYMNSSRLQMLYSTTCNTKISINNIMSHQIFHFVLNNVCLH